MLRFVDLEEDQLEKELRQTLPLAQKHWIQPLQR